MSTPTTNRQIILTQRPQGIPQPSHFELCESPLGNTAAATLVVKNAFLSVDPAQRGYVNDESHYTAPVPIGAVMRAMALGQVVESRDARYAVGDWLYGWFGWQDYCLCDAAAVLRKCNAAHGPLTMNLGVLGINGLTAWLAFYDIGVPRAGETVVVSAAAGAVGSIVCQLARNAGCHVVGIAGDEEKAALCVQRYGCHAAVNYKSATPLAEQVAAACPRGIDIYFDNTGGWILDELLRLMNWFGRVIACGTVAIPAWVPPPTGPRNEREILTRRLRMQGFVVFDHIAAFDATAARLATLIAAGALCYDEDIEDGIANAPAALAGLYEGANKGKKIIRL